jgi:Domain of unknown function (DUF4407)
MATSLFETESDRPGFRVANPFIDFFLWAAKTDRRIMDLCIPWTRKTHAARGFFVFFTSIWACAAAYYALSTMASSKPGVALAVSLLWGAMIFMVDRELVGHWSRKTLWMRVVLATFIGMTVAIPAEMRILQGRIDQQIARQHDIENHEPISRLTARQSELDRRQAALQEQLAQLRLQAQEAGRNREAEVVGAVIAGQTTGIRGKGPAYEAANQRLQLLDEQKQNVESELQRLGDERARVTAEYKDREIQAVHDFPTRYEALANSTPLFTPLWRISWLITLLVILIDMTPVLMKAQSPVTDYDQLLAVQVQENIRRARKIAEYNEQVTSADVLITQPSTLDLLEKALAPTESKA